MKYYMGVDIGTTSVKAIAFDEAGQIMVKHAVSYEMHHPLPNRSEQDPLEIFNGVVTTMNAVFDEMGPDSPVVISFSAAMHSLIAVDAAGEPLSPCIIWADNRAAQTATDLIDSGKGSWLYHTTGVPVHAMSPLCKLLWMQEHQPALFDSASKWIGIKEFVFFRFFQAYVVDTSVATATGFLNLQSLRWDPEVLGLLDLPASKLSEVVPVEQVFHYQPAADAPFSLRLSPEVPVVIGSSDGALANLGTGSTARDAISVTIGTSAAVRVLSDHPATGEEMSVFCYHAIDREWIIGGASNNGAVVLQWLRESLLETSDDFEALFALAATAPAGSDDLLFVPYVLGERAPVWNSAAKGVFFGLTIGHTKAHLVRAAMEGVIFNVYSIGRQIMKITPVNEIFAAGGFVQSPLWLQILADMFNCPVRVPGTQESSALGAMMVGIKALSLPITVHPPIIATYEPDAAQHEIYYKSYEKFKRVYQLLEPEFRPAPEPVQVPA